MHRLPDLHECSARVTRYLRWCAAGNLEKKCIELQLEEPKADPLKILAGVEEAMLTFFVCGVPS